MTPLGFVRAMYCVDVNYKPLRGTAASLRGCPTSAAGSAKFAAQNPALFKAAGFADHPYMRFYPPNNEQNIDPVNPQFASLSPDWASLALIGHLEKALKRAIAVYGSRHPMPVWSTEFGYITSPPKRIWSGDTTPYPSPTVAASYLNWAEYISWKDPNIASYDQYLLQDGLPALRSNDYGSFASGLIGYDGTPKPGLAAWRMPLYLPQTNVSPGRALEVWGDVRPTHFTQMDLAYDSESVNIMFQPAGGSQSTILDTVPIDNRPGLLRHEGRLRAERNRVAQLDLSERRPARRRRPDDRQPQGAGHGQLTRGVHGQLIWTRPAERARTARRLSSAPPRICGSASAGRRYLSCGQRPRPDLTARADLWAGSTCSRIRTRSPPTAPTHSPTTARRRLAAVLPDSAAQVRAVVRACYEAEVPFVARGAGTGLSGGALPVGGGILIVLTRMRRILSVDLANARSRWNPG